MISQQVTVVMHEPYKRACDRPPPVGAAMVELRGRGSTQRTQDDRGERINWRGIGGRLKASRGNRAYWKQESKVSMLNFISAAIGVEAQAMNNFVHLLELADFQHNEDFSTAVRHAITYHGIPALEFADEFGVSPGTVSRWARGKSVPHPMARPRIIKWIASQVQKRRMELEQHVAEITHSSKSSNRILVRIEDKVTNI